MNENVENGQQQSGGDSNRILTAVRVRPLSSFEISEGKKLIVSLGNGDGDVNILNPKFFNLNQSEKERPLHERQFSYDYMFWSIPNSHPSRFSGQLEIYQKVGKPIIRNCLAGLNCSLFAYGQTGSGKTFTMMGTLDGENAGVIPRLCKDLLHELYHPIVDSSSNSLATRRTLAEVEVGYFEVYNERIFDLLSPTPSTNCRVREHPRDGVYVEGLTLKPVKSYENVHNLLIEGHSHRQVASTLMNAESSRSHAIFMLLIKQQLEIPIQSNSSDNPPFKTTSVQRKSKVSLIDLAGSERLNSTGATGDRLKEATNINRSLSVLGDVIRALSEQSSSDNEEKFIPYRNSILTWIMKDSLGGNSKTTMLATISPIDTSYSESMNTLRYVERAKLIISKAIVNDDNSNDPYVRHLQEQVATLKHKLHTLVQRMKQREDEYQTHVEKLKKEYEVKLKKESQKLEQSPSQQIATGFGVGTVVSTGNGIASSKSDDQSLIEEPTANVFDETGENIEDVVKQSKDEINRLRSELHAKIQEMSFLYEDADSYTSQITYLENELKNQQMEYQFQYECLEKYKKEVEESQGKDMEANRVCERLRVALAAKMEDYDEMIKQREIMEEEQERLEQKIKTMAIEKQVHLEEIEKKQQEKEDLEKENTAIKELLKNRDSQLSSGSIELQSVREDLQRVRDELSTTKQELEDRDSQLSSGSIELQSVREDLQRVRDELSITKQELEDRDSQLSSGSIELQSVREDLQRVRDELSTTKQELEDRDSQLSSGSIELQSVREDLQRVRDELSITKQELEDRDSQLSSSVRELDSLRDHTDLVIEVLNGELSATKQELESRDTEINQLHSSLDLQSTQLNDHIANHLEETSLLQAKLIAADAEISALQTSLEQLKHRLPSIDENDGVLAGLTAMNHDIENELSQFCDDGPPPPPPLPNIEALYQAEINQMKETLQKTQSEFNLFLSQSTEIQQSIRDLNEKLAESTRERDHYLEELSRSKEENNDLIEEIAIIRKKLKESQCELSDAVMEVRQKLLEVNRLKQQQQQQLPHSSTSSPIHSEYAMNSNSNQFTSFALSSEHDSDSLAQDLATAKMTIAELNNDLMSAYDEIKQLKKSKGSGTLLSMFK